MQRILLTVHSKADRRLSRSKPQRIKEIFVPYQHQWQSSLNLTVKSQQRLVEFGPTVPKKSHSRPKFTSRSKIDL